MNVTVDQIQDGRFAATVPGFGNYNVWMKEKDYSGLGVGWKVLNSLFSVLADNEELKSLPREFGALYYLNKHKEDLEYELAKW